MSNSIENVESWADFCVCRSVCQSNRCPCKKNGKDCSNLCTCGIVGGKTLQCQNISANGSVIINDSSKTISEIQVTKETVQSKKSKKSATDDEPPAKKTKKVKQIVSRDKKITTALEHLEYREEETKQKLRTKNEMLWDEINTMDIEKLKKFAFVLAQRVIEQDGLLEEVIDREAETCGSVFEAFKVPSTVQHMTTPHINSPHNTALNEAPEQEKEVCKSGSIEPHSPVATTRDWCVCGNCREMPTAVENVCCGYQNLCIGRRPIFQLLCLEPAVLVMVMRIRREIYNDDEELNVANINMRYQGYQNLCLFLYGRLGIGNRTPLPSCCVLGIRNEYPSPDGHYEGFTEVENINGGRGRRQPRIRRGAFHYGH